MAFNVNARYGDNVPTSKDGEVVSVQHVTVTTNNGRANERVEARLFVESDRYTGPTKTAFSFNSIEALDEFIDALATAADDCRTLLENNSKQQESTSTDEVPVKPTVRKRRTVSEQAKSTAAKGKAANAKKAAPKAS